MNELQKAWDYAIHKHNDDDIHDIHNALHVGNMQTQNHVIRECKDICTKEEIIQMNKTNSLQSKYDMELRDLINFLESKKSNFTIKQFKLMLESIWNLINEAKSFDVYVDDDLHNRLSVLEQEYSTLFIENNRKVIDNINIQNRKLT